MGVVSYFKRKAEERRWAAIRELQTQITNLTADKKALELILESYTTFKNNLITLSSDLLDSHTKLERTYQIAINAIVEVKITEGLENYMAWANDIKKEKSNIDSVKDKVDLKIKKLNDSIDEIKKQIDTAQLKITNLGG